MLQKNDEIELQITDMGSDGEGIGRFEGMAFFVPGAITGDRITAGVTKLKKTYGYARLIRIVEPSADRTEPVCPIASKCGGCQLQHMSYAAQLRYKENKVLNDLVRIGGVDAGHLVWCESVGTDGEKPAAEHTSSEATDRILFHRIIGMEHPYNYRNKGQFPVGSSRDGRVISGFYAGHTHSIIETEKCPVQHPIADMLMSAVRSYMTEAGVSAYAEQSGAGLVRHVLTRVGFTTGEVMVCVVVNGRSIPQQALLITKLQQAVDKYNAHLCKEAEKKGQDSIGDTEENAAWKDMRSRAAEKYTLASVTININTANTNVIMGNKCVTLYGRDYIEDYIGNIKYRISPLSFYQVNPVQTLKLYSTALEYAGLTGTETVWDLYCGIGTISLFLARRAARVYGVEIVPQAIEDARVNTEINGITNAEFHVGAAEEVMPARLAADPSIRADVIVVDPPRKGCDEALLDCAVRMEPGRIVYVSCDPATLARDIKYLSGRGYRLCEVQPVDMFGQSGHVETVVLLSGK